MDSKSRNYSDDDDADEFEEMFLLRFRQSNSNLLDSPPPTMRRLPSLTSSPFASSHRPNDTTHANRCSKMKYPKRWAKKLWNFTNKNETQEAEQLDLNKTYTAKTMDSQELTLMLAALDD